MSRCFHIHSRPHGGGAHAFQPFIIEQLTRFTRCLPDVLTGEPGIGQKAEIAIIPAPVFSIAPWSDRDVTLLPDCGSSSTRRRVGSQSRRAPSAERGPMAKRMIVMLVATLSIVAGLGFVKFKQIQTAIAQGAAFVPPPEAVTTIVARQEEWPATLNAIGTVAAVQGVTVSADLPGTVERILFESGQAVKAGDVLAILDTRQEKAQLATIEAQRELAKLTFDRMQGLLNERVISRAEFDRATADYRQSDAQIGEIRTAIERKTIRAPFSGVIGIRQVNLGQYLAGGGALATLQSLNPIYVNFRVPQ